MEEKLTIRQAILVEGKYDKAKLDTMVNALIIPVHGFSVFSDEETKQFIRTLARERGLIILTDSDRAGFTIRGFIGGLVPPEQVTHVYTPDIFGKEKRKEAPSKEGKLGVEGMSRDILLQAFQRAGVLQDGKPKPAHITKLDLLRDGFYGGEGSKARREALYRLLGIPARLSTKAALPLLCSLLTKEEYKQMVETIIDP